MGTWSFTKIDNNNDDSVFNNNMDNSKPVTTPPVGIVNSQKIIISISREVITQALSKENLVLMALQYNP